MQFVLFTEPSSGDTIQKVIKHWIATAMDPYCKCYILYKIIHKMIYRIIYTVMYALCMTSINSLQGMHPVVHINILFLYICQRNNWINNSLGYLTMVKLCNMFGSHRAIIRRYNIYKVIKQWIVFAMDPYYKCNVFHKMIYRIIYIIH
jgi:hypothetical protein